ncbi:hypothetical protein [Pedobacter glucosidilyticus]
MVGPQHISCFDKELKSLKIYLPILKVQNQIVDINHAHLKLPKASVLFH